MDMFGGAFGGNNPGHRTSHDVLVEQLNQDLSRSRLSNNQMSRKSLLPTDPYYNCFTPASSNPLLVLTPQYQAAPPAQSTNEKRNDDVFSQNGHGLYQNAFAVTHYADQMR
jgi:hypothetical protein